LKRVAIVAALFILSDNLFKNQYQRQQNLPIGQAMKTFFLHPALPALVVQTV